MQSFKEFIDEKRNTEAETEELDEATLSRALTILGAAVIHSTYKKVKAEKNTNKKMDRLAELVLLSTAQIFHMLKQVSK